MNTTGRAFHLIDIENLLALTRGRPVGARAGALYDQVVGVGDDDLLTVGADVTRLFDISDAFPNARVCSGRGRDGADRALMKAVDIDLIARRFDTIVIGSGDNAFVDVAYRARQHGLNVVVVSRRTSLGRHLAAHADEVIEMPELELAA